MTLSAMIALLFAAPPPPAAHAAMTVGEHLVLRVPLPRGGAALPPPLPRWKESRASRCIDLAAIAGAAIAARTSVDFVLKGGRRVRAQLGDACPALNYYAGFYLVSPGDGRICADRDSLRTRSGGACEIRRFRLLKPVKP